MILFIEKSAKDLGYKYICLETRVVNERAVKFYKSMAYKVIDNYGRYAGREEAICFKKEL